MQTTLVCRAFWFRHTLESRTSPAHAHLWHYFPLSDAAAVMWPRACRNRSPMHAILLGADASAQAHACTAYIRSMRTLHALCMICHHLRVLIAYLRAYIVHSSLERVHTHTCMHAYKHTHAQARPTRHCFLFNSLPGRMSRPLAYYIRCLRLFIGHRCSSRATCHTDVDAQTTR